MRRFHILLLTAVSAGWLGASEPPVRAQQPTFRAATDLIAVDVQVVDADGRPLTRLHQDQFEVSIRGERRPVVSVDLLHMVGGGSSSGVGSDAAAVAADSWVGRPAANADAPGRVFILAVDVMSFRPSGLERLLNETRQFVNALEPEDVVAIYPFPFEGVTTLTTDRSEVVQALERIVGTRDRFVADGGNYGLNPSDIVDLSTVTPTQRLDSVRQHRVTDICAAASDPEVCGRSVIAEARMLAQIEDGDVHQRLASFRALLQGLSASPHRKTVVLISGGVISADRPDGRPDMGAELGTLVGQEAARANATIYAIFSDSRRTDVGSAALGTRPRTSDNRGRDSALLSRPLERLVDPSGGALFSIGQSPRRAFERILNESSMYYVLGVEPRLDDRDGQPRELEVTIRDLPRGASVRARSWVVVPRPAPLRPSAPAGGR
jgi:VWFA-related protein